MIYFLKGPCVQYSENMGFYQFNLYLHVLFLIFNDIKYEIKYYLYKS